MNIAHPTPFQRFFNDPGPDIDVAALVPAPDLFHHVSTLHGQAHVARVLVHGFRLIEATGWKEEAPRLWAAIYLHDIARTHDGYVRFMAAALWTGSRRCRRSSICSRRPD